MKAWYAQQAVWLREALMGTFHWWRPSPIYIVPQEQVVNVGDVASCVGCTVLLKQAHQVAKLAVQVTKDLDGRLQPGTTTHGKPS